MVIRFRFVNLRRSIPLIVLKNENRKIVDQGNTSGSQSRLNVTQKHSYPIVTRPHVVSEEEELLYEVTFLNSETKKPKHKRRVHHGQ